MGDIPEIRVRTEQREIEMLSPFATRSRFTLGRARPEEPCHIRTEFQRDRDRIIHCKAFRRLKHKTQVFIAPAGDHYVTRLTHTLEVTQIARTITRALNLNEDLAEAIGLGHDLGHTPFGHMGEETLNKLYPEGFKHNRQSLRVVDRLENEGSGLNLTREVRDGILNHSKSMEEILGEGWGGTGSLEGDIVKISDLIAYINHDVDDAVRSGMICAGDIPLQSRRVLGSSHRERINTMVCDIICSSRLEAVQEVGSYQRISMSREVTEAASILKDFLFEHVYTVQSLLQESENARNVVRKLYDYLSCHPGKLPDDYLSISRGDNLRATVDYIAGMTDQYAVRLARQLCL
ncbi:MAG: deoxyguanosinetriphosphate triphosphohydrolase [Dehalococcoidaceae bacterium]|nr:deoxyguanosinetriphosphate triphosphohydrolase [Dehalococcoidaceae bacterium]